MTRLKRKKDARSSSEVHVGVGYMAALTADCNVDRAVLPQPTARLSR